MPLTYFLGSAFAIVLVKLDKLPFVVNVVFMVQFVEFEVRFDTTDLQVDTQSAAESTIWVALKVATYTFL